MFDNFWNVVNEHKPDPETQIRLVLVTQFERPTSHIETSAKLCRNDFSSFIHQLWEESGVIPTEDETDDYAGGMDGY